MFYYHLRYNIYPAPGFPVEKEEWTGYPSHLNETAIKKLLQDKHHTPVSLIHFSLINGETFFEQMEKQLKDKAVPLN